jgi:hypothetical protein
VAGKTTITINGFPFDLAETEEHSLKAEITEHPVEDGSDISDNIRIKPRELTLTNLVVSNTPTGAIASDPTRQLNGTSPPPATNAYNMLIGWFNAREPVAVVTNLQKYPSMGIEEITVPVEAKSFGGLVVTVHLKQVIIVQNKRVTMKYPNTGAEQNTGLSLDHLVDGQRVLWRHGNPPGTSPSTVPAGVITQTETVISKQTPNHTRFVHESTGNKLTDQELQDFAKDLERDQALMTDRALYKANQALDNQGDVIQRANNMANYKAAHPGSNPDPSQFGLKQGPDGHWGCT